MSLQAVDIFLWLYQRKDKIRSLSLRSKLLNITEPFYISKKLSEMKVKDWLYKLSNNNLTEEQIKEGKRTTEKIENIHLVPYRQNSVVKNKKIF